MAYMRSCLSCNAIVLYIFNGAPRHGGSNVPLESFVVKSQIVGCFFVQRVRGVWLEKEELHWLLVTQKWRLKDARIYAPVVQQ